MKQNNISTQKSKSEIIKAFQQNPQSFLESLRNNEIDLSITTIDKSTVLHCFKGVKDKKTLELLVEKCSKINILNNKNDQGYTPLMLAFMSNNPLFAKILLLNKADVEIIGNGKHNVLHWAYCMNNLEVSNKIETILENESKVEVLKMLVQQCAHLNILNKQNAYGQSALILATANKNLELVKLLLEYKASVEIKAQDNSTVLHYLSNLRDQEVRKLLVEVCVKAGIVEERRIKWPHESALTVAVSKKDFILVDLLLNAGGKFELTECKDKILVNGVEASETIRNLCEKYSPKHINLNSSNYINSDSSNLLLIRVDHCINNLKGLMEEKKEEKNILLEFVKKNEVEKIKKLLLQDKVDLQVAQGSKGTILHYSHNIKDSNTLRQLVEKHAQARLLDKIDKALKATALMNAVFYDNPELVKLLLSAGADISKTSAFKETALHYLYILKDDEAKELLIEYGAKAKILEKKNKNGETALKKCIIYGDQTSVKLLKEKIQQDFIFSAPQNNFNLEIISENKKHFDDSSSLGDQEDSDSTE